MENKDFQKIHHTSTCGNIWLLGYFGGGSINFSNYRKIAEQFSEEIGCPIDTVEIDEIFQSNWCKGFKYLYSTYTHQKKIDSYKKVEDLGKYFKG